MEQEQDTPWIQSTEHTNIQKRESGQQTRKLEHHSSIQLMDHYLKTMSQVGMHRQIVFWKQWPSLRNPTQGSLKTRVLKRWKSFSKQEWTN
ncbi:PB1-F2 protein [Influenza A virus (A/red-necked stint/Western Australia/4126/1980(H4N8))]|uniref:Protein PB1-F2 n=8 Tax=Influenza A virus TaxID=11320 RepID=Q20PI0_9INFA|nr:PB1-F2 protein [Influenza A virus (A/red-necked stint/Australia/4189/1980(H4N8))]ABB20413.1 PB1-F2 protein [Influenza A virus (A/red-necked stint/Australia/4500/1980(H3N8))]ABX88863.1 PB1-F2 protein [Influenza A virus (A/red-necked stint/Bunbury/4500/1980(H3N8))]ABX88874.1 PB1-F2 protein [Influenza A virus (A/red-necked stint/Western Australia/4923/1983(H3N8))]ACA04583.1 PB1-F2 protein [Influenza A virus (A/red-necked stint/Western Australia/4915/1984(H3N8))]ACF22428.1 PB1-F2 protein [Influ